MTDLLKLDLKPRKKKGGYRVSHSDRVVGVIKPAYDVWMAKPTGSSVWTMWPTPIAAACHCLAFVGWADIAEDEDAA